MIIVIDAYNVLKQAHSVEHISEASRQQFIKQLGRYGTLKGHSLICVFDGGPYEGAHKERVHGVYVVYSGVHETADEWIKNYIERYKAQDLLLISTDRALNRSVKQFGIESMDAVDFYALLQQATRAKTAQKNSNQPLVKLTQDNQELDQLMEQASKVMITKVEDVVGVTPERTSKAHALSKKERKVLQKLKKL